MDQKPQAPAPIYAATTPIVAADGRTLLISGQQATHADLLALGLDEKAIAALVQIESMTLTGDKSDDIPY